MSEESRVGRDMRSILEEIRRHEARRHALMIELEAIASRAAVEQPDVDVVSPEMRRRIRRWRDVVVVGGLAQQPPPPGH
jgi:hypothetical protein